MNQPGPPVGGHADEQDDDVENVDEDEEWPEREHHGDCPICDAPMYESAENPCIETTCRHLLAGYEHWPFSSIPDTLYGISVPWECNDGLENWGKPLYERLDQIQQYFAKLSDEDGLGVEHARQTLLDRLGPHRLGGWLDDVLQYGNPLRLAVHMVESVIEKTPAVKTSAGGANRGMASASAPYYLWAKRPTSAWKQLSARLDSEVAEAVRIADLVRAEAGVEPEKITEIEPTPESEPWSDRPILDAHTITLSKHSGRFGPELDSTISIRRTEDSTWHSSGSDDSDWSFKRCHVSESAFQSVLSSLVAAGYFAINDAELYHVFDAGTKTLEVEGPTARRRINGFGDVASDVNTARRLFGRACILVSEFVDRLPWQLDIEGGITYREGLLEEWLRRGHS